MRIFVLEDNPYRIKSIQRSLIGHMVMMTSNIANAKRILKDNKFDLIMLDHDLDFVTSDRNINGMLIVDYLIEHPHTCPIIVHSLNNLARNKMIERLKEAGYDVRGAPFCWDRALEKNMTIPDLYDIRASGGAK